MNKMVTRFFKRRTFVVRRKLQLTLMILSFGYVILFCVAMGTYLFFPLMMELDNSEIGSGKALVASIRILYLHERFWPGLILSFFVIGCHSIFISHKIAGPLLRFNLIFKAIKEGIMSTPTQLRAGDYLYSELENINQMLEVLREKLTGLQETQANLNSSIIKCKDAVPHISTDELIKKMEDLAAQSKNLEEKLGYFKVVSE